MSDSIQDFLNRKQPVPKVELQPKVLTKTEIQVLQLTMHGLTDLEIGDMTGKSCRTINHQRSKIIKKANAKNMIHAVVKYITYYPELRPKPDQ